MKRWFVTKVQIAWPANICQRKYKSEGKEIWCLANSKSEFIYNFDIYCGNFFGVQERLIMPCGKSSIAHEVVMKSAIDLENKGHCIATCRINCIWLSSTLKNT